MVNAVQQPHTREIFTRQRQRFGFTEPTVIRVVQRSCLSVVFLEGCYYYADGERLITEVTQAGIDMGVMDLQPRAAVQIEYNNSGGNDNSRYVRLRTKVTARLNQIGFGTVAYVRFPPQINGNNICGALQDLYMHALREADIDRIKFACFPLLGVVTNQVTKSESLEAFKQAVQQFTAGRGSDRIQYLKCIRLTSENWDDSDLQKIGTWPEQVRQSSRVQMINTTGTEHPAQTPEEDVLQTLRYRQNAPDTHKKDQINLLQQTVTKVLSVNSRRLLKGYNASQGSSQNLSQVMEGDISQNEDGTFNDEMDSEERETEIAKAISMEGEEFQNPIIDVAMSSERSRESFGTMHLRSQKHSLAEVKSYAVLELLEQNENFTAILKEAITSTISSIQMKNLLKGQKLSGLTHSWHMDPDYDNKFHNDFMADSNLTYYQVWPDYLYYGTQQLIRGREVLLDSISELFFQCGARVSNFTVNAEHMDDSDQINRQLIRSMLQQQGVLELALLGINGNLKLSDKCTTIKNFLEYFLQIGVVRAMIANLESASIVNDLDQVRLLQAEDQEQAPGRTPDYPFVDINRHLNVGKEAFIGENPVGALFRKQSQRILDGWNALETFGFIAVPYCPNNSTMKRTFKGTATETDAYKERLFKAQYTSTTAEWTQTAKTGMMWCAVPIDSFSVPGLAEMQLNNEATESSMSYMALFNEVGQAMTGLSEIRVAYCQTHIDFTNHLKMLDDIWRTFPNMTCQPIQLKRIRQWYLPGTPTSGLRMLYASQNQPQKLLEQVPELGEVEAPDIINRKIATQLRPLIDKSARAKKSNHYDIEHRCQFDMFKLLSEEGRKSTVDQILLIFQDRPTDVGEYNQTIEAVNKQIKEWEKESAFFTLIKYFTSLMITQLYDINPTPRQLRPDVLLKTAHASPPGQATKNSSHFAPIHVMNSLFDSVVWLNALEFIKARYSKSCPTSDKIIADKIWILKFILDGGFMLTKKNGYAVGLVSLANGRKVGFQEGHQLSNKELVSVSTCGRHLNYILSENANCTRVVLKVDYEGSRWRHVSHNSQLLAARLIGHNIWQICDQSGYWFTLSAKPKHLITGLEETAVILRFLQGSIKMQILDLVDPLIRPRSLLLSATLLRIERQIKQLNESAGFTQDNSNNQSTVLGSLYIGNHKLPNKLQQQRIKNAQEKMVADLKRQGQLTDEVFELEMKISLQIDEAANTTLLKAKKAELVKIGIVIQGYYKTKPQKNPRNRRTNSAQIADVLPIQAEQNPVGAGQPDQSALVDQPEPNVGAGQSDQVVQSQPYVEAVQPEQLALVDQPEPNVGAVQPEQLALVDQPEPNVEAGQSEQLALVPEPNVDQANDNERSSQQDDQVMEIWDNVENLGQNNSMEIDHSPEPRNPQSAQAIVNAMEEGSRNSAEDSVVAGHCAEVQREHRESFEASEREAIEREQMNEAAQNAMDQFEGSMSDAAKTERIVMESGITNQEALSFIYAFISNRQNPPLRPENNSELRDAIVSACEVLYNQCKRDGLYKIAEILEATSEYANQRVVLTMQPTQLACSVCNTCDPSKLQLCPSCNHSACQTCNLSWEHSCASQGIPSTCPSCRGLYEISAANIQGQIGQVLPPVVVGRPINIGIFLGKAVKSYLLYDLPDDAPTDRIAEALREQKLIEQPELDSDALRILQQHILREVIVNVDGQRASFSDEIAEIMQLFASDHITVHELRNLNSRMLMCYSREIHRMGLQRDGDIDALIAQCKRDYVAHFSQFDNRLRQLYSMSQAANQIHVRGPVSFQEQFQRANAAERRCIRENLGTIREELAIARQQERTVRLSVGETFPECASPKNFHEYIQICEWVTQKEEQKRE